MTVKELCEQHKLSAKNAIRHCQKGRFVLDDITYMAKDVSGPGSKNSKWVIEPEKAKANGTADRRHTQGGSLKDARVAVQIKKDQVTIQMLEQQLKEKKIEHFLEYLNLEKEAMHHSSAELKLFIAKFLTNEADIQQWNSTWANYIENVYNQVSSAILESL